MIGCIMSQNERLFKKKARVSLSRGLQLLQWLLKKCILYSPIEWPLAIDMGALSALQPYLKDWLESAVQK